MELIENKNGKGVSPSRPVTSDPATTLGVALGRHELTRAQSTGRANSSVCREVSTPPTSHGKNLKARGQKKENLINCFEMCERLPEFKKKIEEEGLDLCCEVLRGGTKRSRH